MRLRVAFAGLLSFLVVQPIFAAQLVNLGSEFDAFVKASQGKTSQDVEAEWVKFESKHQAIYDSAVYRKSEKDWEQRLRNSSNSSLCQRR